MKPNAAPLTSKDCAEAMLEFEFSRKVALNNVARSNVREPFVAPGVGRASKIAIEENVGMDWDRVEGNWKQLKGKVKEKWGKLTDDDLDVIDGQRDQLEGRIQQRYGLAKDQVRKDVDDWVAGQRW